ncbi:ATP-binding protein [Streptomyces sp. NPDC091025]|uniref:ATP-binding protein n=1 Tax=Streptomyces sp. NPDC091025 TaxID=3365970 RepID=UPI00381B56FD
MTGEVAFAAELLLSELVTNSVLHARVPARRGIGLRVARYDGRLRVEVADANNGRRAVRATPDASPRTSAGPPGGRAPTGRGW